ncbi:iron uptake porin [Limnothrix redekei]|uniref:Iron uptake porin n=1 Tax=Limnothrix redekei LRLZ20PSL1 TaxID=3112953 RepID=A0ABW7C9M7_9CYAN
MKLFWNALRLSPAAAGLSLLLAQGAFAGEATTQTNIDASPSAIELGLQDDLASMDQVTSVSQLSDVQPTDWAFQALQSLVERYGCIAGYPDGTFKGNRPLSRYEFAAGLNACLDRINDLIKAATDPLATKEDLRKLQKLQEEFAAELAALRGRVDALEARTSELEANQFSTTTKLTGEVVMAVAAGLSDVVGDDDNDEADNATFSHRVRLNFNTSFTGKDLLRTRLQVGNVPRYYSSETNMARLAWESNTSNNFVLDELYYRFPLNSANTWRAFVGTTGLDIDDIHYTANPLLESSADGALSRFGRYNPLFRQPQGAGIGVNYKGERFRFAASYLASEANDPQTGAGLFDGSYSAAASLYYSPSKTWDIGLLYAYAYHSTDARTRPSLTGGTGSFLGDNPFRDPTTAHNVGVQTTAKLSKNFVLSGWAGWTFADAEDNGDGSADLFNWALTFAFPDLFKEGSVGALIVGQQPNLYNADNTVGGEDDDNSWHIEALYKFAVNDNISITPGVIVVTDANHDNDNDTAVLGVLRTVFKF